jgi:epsin
MDMMSRMTDLASYARNAAVQATTLVAGSELEKKLTEACSNEPWGASGTMLSELARATFSYDDFKTVMAFVWKNMQLTGSLWRVVYKTLNLLDHLIRNGSERVIEDARDHTRELKGMQKFEFVDPDGKDTGVNVREKAKQIVELLNNEDVLNEEREKARSARNRYTGVSAQDMGVESAELKAPPMKADVKGFSDDDFKFAADRGRSTSSASYAGMSFFLGSAFSTVTEYAQAANKQMQSMSTLFPSSELDRKLSDATNNEPTMPSSGLLYELGRVTHRDEDYRIVTSAIWQHVGRDQTA